jgi:hypothetical protein
LFRRSMDYGTRRKLGQNSETYKAIRFRQREAMTEQVSRPATLEDLETLLRSLNATALTTY